MAIYALLIGINDYAGNVPDLSGCHNDVERFSNVLKSRFNTTTKNIKLLLSSNATKANIIAGFKTHLAQAGEGDTVVVYYSGHGSQERAPEVFWDMEPDRQNETIVCHDSRTGAGDLADKELRFLIAQLAKKKPHIVVIFDCCHSGGATRGTETVLPQAVRLTKPDVQSRALQNYVFFEQAEQEGWASDMQKLPEGAHIFLSGCQDSELSKELTIEGKQHGVFTHFLCKTLESSASSLSYRNIVSRINQQVQGLVQKQHPQVEGIEDADVNRLFLGEEIQAVTLSVVARNNQWLLNAGEIQGMSVGDQLAIYKDGEETALDSAVITSVTAESSVLTLTDDALKVADAYQATIVNQVKPKLAIKIEGDTQGVAIARKVLDSIEKNGDASRLLKEETVQASYRLIAADNRYTISLVIDDKPLFMPVEGGYNEHNAKKVLRQLEHMAKWQHKLELTSFNSSTIADDAVQLVVTHIGEEFIDEDMEFRYHPSHGSSKWEEPEYTLELRLNPEMDHPKPLYCALLYFTPLDGSIQLATNNGNGVWLKADQTLDVDNGSPNIQHAKPRVKLFDGKVVQGFVDDVVYAQGISEATDILKLIVSETEFSPSLLEQKGLEVYDVTLDPQAKTTTTTTTKSVTRGGNALSSMLDDAMQYTNTRGIRAKQTTLANWTTKSFTMTTIRPLEQVMIPNNKAASLGLGVEIEPHAMTAAIRLESQIEANRGLEAIGMGRMATPVALQNSPLTPAYSLAATRSADANLSVIKLDGITDSEKVTAQNPLVLSIDKPLAEGEQVLPFAFDGEFYYPLGHAVAQGNKTRILIETLPDAETTVIDSADSTNSTDGTVTAKSLGGSLKLYFQKVLYSKLRLKKDSVRLAMPVFAADHPQKVMDYNADNEEIKAQVAAAKKIVVFIHGIIGDTESMAGVVNFPMADESFIRDHYDVVLCFDYENLSTPIEETARLFKAKLEAVGLAEGHGKHVHIVAHSMGGLVSRWMIEREGGNKLVDKLVMLGTPNNGSPWAGVKDKGIAVVSKWAYGSLTLILNGLTTIPVGGVAVAGMMKLINSMDDTLDQMGENSDFLQQLYQSPDPEIPYYLVAGATQKLMVNVNEEDGMFKKVMTVAMQRSKLAAYDFLSDSLFAKQNDVAVNATSMKHIDEARTPALDVVDIVSDHMSYFTLEEGVEALDMALKN
ncbi:MAG TPA: hypothetical protein ENJ33_05905 [Thiothrix sp.]|nr:hypothetical protein [Thiothrix sp.]